MAKCFTPRYIIGKNVGREEQGENLESWGRKTTHHIQLMTHQKPWRPEGSSLAVKVLKEKYENCETRILCQKKSLKRKTK